jgi:hypothetical protein
MRALLSLRFKRDPVARRRKDTGVEISQLLLVSERTLSPSRPLSRFSKLVRFRSGL